MHPRDYQDACHTAIWRFIHDPKNFGKNPLVIMPTGTGKSFQMALFIWHILTRYPYARIMSLAHVQELVDSNMKELLGILPTAPVGLYASGLGSKDHHGQVTFAMIQSVYNKAALFKKIDFLLVDEAHMISDNDGARYDQLIKDLQKVNPNLVVIGYTATAFRMKTGVLTDGKLFDDVAFDLSDGDAFLWLIQQGYLARPVPIDPGFQIDDSMIGIQAGDFNDKEASEAMRDQNILERGVDACIQAAKEQGRKTWLHFAQSIDDAELLADMFTYKGYPHEAVHSKRSDREAVLEAFAKGELTGITNKDILTTGFNHKPIDLIGGFRLTRSPGLWVQIVGRGTRPVYAPGFDLTTANGRLAAMAASGKGLTCLVLDFMRNTERLGPINYPNIPKRRKPGGGGDPIVKKCPECKPNPTYHHSSVRVCPECGYEFPPPEKPKLDPSKSKLVVEVSEVIDLNLKLPEPVFKVEPVHRMVASKNEGKVNKKTGEKKPDTMRVDYFCGFARYSDWICLEHAESSFPHRRAREWWKAHGGRGPIPVTIDEGIEAFAALNKPKWIKIKMVDGALPQIEAYDFLGTKFELPPELGGPPIEDVPPDPVEALKDQSTKQNDQLKNRLGYDLDDEIPF